MKQGSDWNGVAVGPRAERSAGLHNCEEGEVSKQINFGS